MKSSERILRLGAFGVFLGHGVVAVGGHDPWIPLLTSVGFTTTIAKELMPLIGYLDIIIAFFLLFFPIRIVLIWASLWAFATALSRPIAGYSIWSFVERAGNWAVPLALLLYNGMPTSIKSLFKVH